MLTRHQRCATYDDWVDGERKQARGVSVQGVAMAIDAVMMGFGIVLIGISAWAVWRAIPRRFNRSRYAVADLSVVLEQIPVPESAAADLVRAWADGRSCARCGNVVTEQRSASHHIALLDPGGVTREWVDIGADRLTIALGTSLPVCWNCHLAASFRRLHPELVTDRDDWAMRARRHDL